MSLILAAGFVLIAIFLAFKQHFFQLVHSDSALVQTLSRWNWFKNDWLAGIFLFFFNAILFAAAVGLIFLTGRLEIPYVHLILMFAATVTSLYMWMAVRQATDKVKKGSLIMGSIGSSFYLLLLLVFLYMFVTLGPDTPENDTFMAAIGLFFGMFVALVALVTCFSITGLPGRRGAARKK